MLLKTKLGLLLVGVLITLLVFYSDGGLRKWEVFGLSIGLTTLFTAGGVMVYNFIAGRKKEDEQGASQGLTYSNRIFHALVGALITLLVILIQWS